MKVYSKNKQFEGLGNFFLDMGKGLILGSIGVTTLATSRLLIVVLSGFSAIGCVFTGLYFLGKIEKET